MRSVRSLFLTSLMAAVLFSSAAAQWGNHARFDGVTGVMTTYSSPAITITGIVTVEAMIKPVRTGGTLQVVRLLGTGNDGCELQIKNDGTVLFNAQMPSGSSWYYAASAAVDVFDGNWHHVAGVVDGTLTLSLYVDGTLRASAAGSESFGINGNGTVMVGKHPFNANIFRGAIDEVRVSDIARYNGATCTVPAAEFTPDANTIVLFHYNDATDGVTADDGSNGLNGTFLGGSAVLHGFAGGDGSTDDPYQVATAEQLNEVRFFLNKTFLQTADIDLAGTSYAIESGFGPIGGPTSAFTGAYHGRGHRIKNLVIRREWDSYTGLFGFTGVSSVIDSLHLWNVQINGFDNVGGLAGLCQSDLHAISVTGSVSSPNAGSVGGVAGLLFGTVTECSFAGAVFGSNGVGGFAGVNNGTIGDCYANASVRATYQAAGGFLGTNTGSVSRCYVTGSVRGNGDIGAFIGDPSSGSVQSCYWKHTTIPSNGFAMWGTGSCTDTAGLTVPELQQPASFSGWNFSTVWDIAAGHSFPGLRAIGNNAPMALDTAVMVNHTVALSGLYRGYDLETGTMMLAFRIDTVFGALQVTGRGTVILDDLSPRDSLIYRAGEVIGAGDTLWGAPAMVTFFNQNYVPLSGAGTELSPYLITSYSDLKKVKYDLSAIYRLTSNIDASASASENDGAGFTPIGGAGSGKSFVGTLHGGGHAIDRLTIHGAIEVESIGLFGEIAFGTVVDSLGVTNADISGFSNVGSIAGKNDGIIDHCRSSGTITSTPRSWGSFGGLVGTGEGTLTNSYSLVTMDCASAGSVGGAMGSGGSIFNCFAAGSVTGANNVGGLVGEAWTSIENCFASGNVTATDGVVGGLIGETVMWTPFTIKNCYATGSVTGMGAGYVGGLIGYAQQTLINCYATGSVSGPSSVGGFSGAASNAVIDHCYWNMETGYAVGNGDDYGGNTFQDTSGLTTAQMTVQSNYVGWDFTMVWEMVPGSTPRLISVPEIALPVQLNGFTASVHHGIVELSWHTATEVNNLGFDIERSFSSERWQKIGSVEGNGTSNIPHSYRFIDRTVSGTASYRLKQIDRDGRVTYSSTVEVTAAVPKQFSLQQNFPNPFNPTTVIRYELPVNSRVTLTVYDAIGRKVADLVNDDRPAGVYDVPFNGTSLASGTYFYRLQAGVFSAVKKFTLMK